jgi:hypothetical protein
MIDIIAPVLQQAQMVKIERHDDLMERQTIDRHKIEGNGCVRNIFNYVNRLALVVLISIFIQNLYLIDSLGQNCKKCDYYHEKINYHSENFYIFFEKFSDDESIQRKFTKRRIKILQLEFFQKKEKIKNISYNDIKFPVIPIRENRIKQSLEIKVENVSKNNAKAILFRGDSDDVTTYYFRKSNCWKLERIVYSPL